MGRPLFKYVQYDRDRRRVAIFAKRGFAGGVCFALILFSPLVLGSYDRAIPWSDPAAISPQASQRLSGPTRDEILDPQVRDSELQWAISDTQKRVPEDFKIPPELFSTVKLWLRVYTEWTRNDVVIYDEDHPEWIYDVIDLKTELKSAKNKMQFEILSDQLIQKRINEIRRGLKALQAFAQTNAQSNAKNQKSRSKSKNGRQSPLVLSVTAEKILRVVESTNGPEGPQSHFKKHSWKTLASSVRAQRGLRDSLIQGIQKASPYLPDLERIFSDLDVPKEMILLSLVESSFNQDATSRVGATGVWQFMESSGKEFLKINPGKKIDERRSPIKAGVAAAQLLRRNRLVVGNWPSAVIAYNHGFTGLFKIKKKERTPPKLWKYLTLCGKSPLGWASRNYYSEFLAMVHVDAYRDLFFPELDGTLSDQNLAFLPSHNMRLTQFYRLTQVSTPAEISMKLGVGLEDFKKLNPDLRDVRVKVPKGFWVVVPKRTLSTSPSTKEYLKKRRT